MWLQSKTYLRGLGQVMSHETAKNAKKTEKNLQKYINPPKLVSLSIYKVNNTY